MSKPVKIVVISTAAVVVTLAIVLGCVFGIKCTVTFYSEVPFLFPSESSVIANRFTNDIETIKVVRYSALTPKIPIAADYKFLGWYRDTALTVPWISGTRVNRDITLYAKWGAK